MDQYKDNKILFDNLKLIQFTNLEEISYYLFDF